MNNFYNLNNFEWDIYLLKNNDLVENNINTKEKAIIHFETHGIKERRFINRKMIELWENYDWIKYKNNNPKLKTLDEISTFFHYYFVRQENKDNIFKKEEIIFFEKEENYKKYIDLYENYDWSKYLSDYQDLKNANIKSNFECFIHYINYGINEGRQIYNKKDLINNNSFDINRFDYDFFIKINNKLKNINNQEDAINYLKNIDNDKLDKTIYNTTQKDIFEKYDWNEYIKIHEDLKNAGIKTNIECFRHYIIHGINEGRQIFKKEIIDNNFDINIFDFVFFIKMNNNLKNINTIEDAISYLKYIDNNNLDKIIYTTKQKNLYEKYDWIKYINIYDDLKKNFKNEIDGYKHYIFYGINENRKVFKKKNIPLDFDYKKYYINYYDELKNFNKCEIEEYYIKQNINKTYNTFLDKSLNKINKDTFGIAISLYIDENTPIERIIRSEKCIMQICSIFNNQIIIIVIDNKITNNYLLFLKKIVNKYKNIQIYRNKINFGISKTKNICMKLLEEYNVNYICLLDDDIFIKKNYISYILNLLENNYISFISNGNITNCEKKIINNNIFYQLKYFSDTDTYEYYGNFLIINSYFLKKHGYFYLFNSKIGVEHIEITRRYLKNNQYNGLSINLQDYLEDFEIINNINTLFLHSKNVVDNDYKSNVDNFISIKNIDFYNFEIDYNEIIKINNNIDSIMFDNTHDLHKIATNNKKLYIKYNNNENNLLNYINYNYDLINKNLNYVNYICWINLDRSIDRNKYMKNILKDINISNYRISAVDGKENNLIELYKKNISRTNITNYEIACTLSHIKAINFLNNIEGEYFMICEDDISFENILIFKNSLKEIIEDAPKFDILLIYKTYLQELKNKYEKWIDHLVYEPQINHICGTVCYIISKKGIEKFIKNNKYIDNLNFIINNSIEVADIHLFKDLETYVYKYNFITTKLETSTIHGEHLDFHKQSIDHQNKVLLDDINDF